MESLQEKIELLEKSIKKLENRNKKVEADKSWETSNFRKISVAVITYLIILIIMYLLDFKDIFINALIPTFGFLLSTLSIVKSKHLVKWSTSERYNFHKINFWQIFLKKILLLRANNYIQKVIFYMFALFYYSFSKLFIKNNDFIWGLHCLNQKFYKFCLILSNLFLKSNKSSVKILGSFSYQYSKALYGVFTHNSFLRLVCLRFRL